MRVLRVLGVALLVAGTALLSSGASSADPLAATASYRAGPALVSPAALRAAESVAVAAPAAVAAAPAAARLAAGTPCRATARACIQLSTNRAWLIRGGVVEYGPVRISHGRKGYRTPAGTFRVSFKSINHVSSIYGSPMPYSVFFNGGIAFHQGSLATRSHGCVRLSRAAAKTFYGSLSPGNVVQVVR